MHWLADLILAIFSKKTVEMPTEDTPKLREDQKLSEHFSLFELTATDNVSLQEVNRTLMNDQVEKLRTLAAHAEVIRSICGVPIKIHSGYRSGALNGATVGSSSTSQHPRCEAIDFSGAGQRVDDTFNLLLAAARSKKFKFGQLILEKAERSYGTVTWVHCSVVGTLDIKKVGQVMKMVAGADGKPCYTLIDTIKFEG